VPSCGKINPPHMELPEPSVRGVEPADGGGRSGADDEQPARIAARHGQQAIADLGRGLAARTGGEPIESSIRSVPSSAAWIRHEFMRRFLQHVLPKGLHKVRYYGLWHPTRREHAQRARIMLLLDRPATSSQLQDPLRRTAQTIGQLVTRDPTSPESARAVSRAVSFASLAFIPNRQADHDPYCFVAKLNHSFQRSSIMPRPADQQDVRLGKLDVIVLGLALTHGIVVGVSDPIEGRTPASRQR
jgi:Putative transposase